jgi:drug/metabolite transporter (DMT)-like permease
VVVFFGCMAGVLLGAINVALRLGLRRHPDVGLASIVVALIALPISAAISAAAGLAGDVRLGELWPFFVAGMVVPGVSQLLWVRSVHDTGASRSAIVMSVTPLFSALIAIALRGESLEVALAVGTALIVAGGIVLAHERERPPDFKAIGVAIALLGALLAAGRDNAVRGVVGDSDVPPLLAGTAMIAGACALLVLYGAIVRPRALQQVLSVPIVVPFLPAGLLMALIYVCYLEGFDRGEVTVVAPLNATYALWAVAFTALLLGKSEALGKQLVLAAALIVAGAALIGATG